MSIIQTAGKDVLHTPVWVLAARIAQLVLSLIIVGITAWWIHGVYHGSLGFVIACWIFTWAISLYNIIVEKVASARKSYNTWATLSLDALMIIFWLASMAANAHYRSLFTVDVIANCSSDGSLVNSGQCVTYSKRGTVATDAGLAALDAIAGLSALEMLLFVASFAYVCHFFRLSIQGTSHTRADLEKNGNVSHGAYNTAEMNADMPRVGGQTQVEPLLHQPQQYPWQPSQTGGGQQPAPYHGDQPYDPYQGAAGVQQSLYNPPMATTPAPSMPYHPPQ